MAQEQYNAKDTDFASILTKIKGKDFDVLYIAGYYGEAGLIIKQARESGIDCNIVGADGFESEKLAELAGKENLNNVWYTTCYTTVNASDELKSFIDDYTAKYDQAPNMFSALAYDATNLVLDQLEATGKTGAELNEAIKKADFSGLTGSFVFDEKTHTRKRPCLSSTRRMAYRQKSTKSKSNKRNRIMTNGECRFPFLSKGGPMSQFLQQVINGLSLGSIYALIALGYTMVYGIIKLINFAHGDVYMVGAYTAFICTAWLGFGFFPALIASMVVCGLLGVLIERLAYKPLRKAPGSQL